MKVGLAQINPVIGDFSGNCKKIVNYARKAYEAGCKLVVFPEMAVSGYPPQDLLERPSFLDDHDRAVAEMIREFPALDVMFGCIEKRQDRYGKPLYNAAFVAREGEIVFKARKQLLPTYDVFDETRYFQPGHTPELYELGEYSFGVTVCEDIWYDEVQDYKIDPVESLFDAAKDQGKTINGLINISASPFQLGKEDLRRNIFKRYAIRHKVPLVFCNQVGGQDSLIFDGRSKVVDEKGEVITQAYGFKEDFVAVDLAAGSGDMNDLPDLPVMRAVHDGLVLGVRDYVRKCGFASVVIGLSGGIDSALTAAIAVRALGPDKVLGVAMPSPYSSEGSLNDARDLAHNLGCNFRVIPIEPLFNQFNTSLADIFAGRDEDLTEQNIQARIRGNLLMAISNKFGSMLLTTGNKSEMAVGYCTLYGDMSGGLAVISDVPKQLVYELAHFVNSDREIIPENTIEKPPSAELKPDQTDQDDLPPYEVLDKVLEMYLERGMGVEEIISQGVGASVTRDIVHRIRVNEYKRKQAPLGLKVTSKAFGVGRRYPITQNYRG